MGNKKASVWVVELFTNKAKTQMLKVYEFSTARHRPPNSFYLTIQTTIPLSIRTLTRLQILTSAP